MCFFAWRHANGGGERGIPHDRWVSQPPMIGGATLLLEAWSTCHEWVWMLGDVFHIGSVAMMSHQSMCLDHEPSRGNTLVIQGCRITLGHVTWIMGAWESWWAIRVVGRPPMVVPPAHFSPIPIVLHKILHGHVELVI
jgi:hypothetical protein